MSKADEIQYGGDHYKVEGAEQHWTFAYRHNYNPFEYSATKYVLRCWKKNGVEDLRKARHHLQKYLEVTNGLSTVKVISLQDSVKFHQQYDIQPEQRAILNLIHVGLIEDAVEALASYIEASEPPREYVNPDL